MKCRGAIKHCSFSVKLQTQTDSQKLLLNIVITLYILVWVQLLYEEDEDDEDEEEEGLSEMTHDWRLCYRNNITTHPALIGRSAQACGMTSLQHDQGYGHAIYNSIKLQ